MSWSVSAIGKPAAVAKKLAEDFSRITYLGPEEKAIKDAIAGVVEKTLAATAPNTAVEVEASGSFSGGLQSARMDIRPKYGFVE